MNNNASKLTAVIGILATDLPKKDKLVLSRQQLSGLDITNIDTVTKKHVTKHILEMNDITTQYPIKTDDDYVMISDVHLNKLLKSIKQLVKCLIDSL